MIVVAFLIFFNLKQSYCLQALSYGMLEMAKRQDVSLNQLSTLGDACLKMDLKAIHKILVMAEDDKELVEVTKLTNLKQDSAGIKESYYSISWFCS